MWRALPTVNENLPSHKQGDIRRHCSCQRRYIRIVYYAWSSYLEETTVKGDFLSSTFKHPSVSRLYKLVSPLSGVTSYVLHERDMDSVQYSQMPSVQSSKRWHTSEFRHLAIGLDEASSLIRCKCNTVKQAIRDRDQLSDERANAMVFT